MANDKPSQKKEYVPENYWNQRAVQSEGNLYQAIGVIKGSYLFNKTMDIIQRNSMSRGLRKLPFSNGKALDYGCGIGRYVSLFEKTDFEWYGSDIASNMISLARSKYPDKTIKKIEGGKIPYPDNYFDLAYTVTVIHHNPYDQQASIFKELHRILKEEGYLIIYEDIGADQLGWNLFPRSKEGWIVAAQRENFSFQGCIPSRKVIISVIGYYLDQPMNKILSLKKRFQLFQTLFGILGLLIDPLLVAVIPEKYATEMLFLFKKVTPN